MDAIFSVLDLSYTRVPAVDGGSLSNDQRKRAQPGGNFYPLGPGEIGCFLSHRNCWKIAAGEKGYTAIFEDDVHFGSGFHDLLWGAAWVPDGVDVVKLENELAPDPGGKRAIPAPGGRSLMQAAWRTRRHSRLSRFGARRRQTASDERNASRSH